MLARVRLNENKNARGRFYFILARMGGRLSNYRMGENIPIS